MSSSKAAGESKPESYPQGCVEDFDEPRTKLAGFFSILPDHPLASSHFLQFNISPRCWLRPSAVRTHGRFVIGGWWRTC